jgi:hypothetical protein
VSPSGHPDEPPHNRRSKQPQTAQPRRDRTEHKSSGVCAVPGFGIRPSPDESRTHQTHRPAALRRTGGHDIDITDPASFQGPYGPSERNTITAAQHPTTTTGWRYRKVAATPVVASEVPQNLPPTIRQRFSCGIGTLPECFQQIRLAGLADWGCRRVHRVG